MIDIDNLRRRVGYDPRTGSLFWKSDPPKGRAVGEKLPVRDNGNGYVYASFDRRGYGVHRLAWAVMTGVWPEEVDHIDLDKTNNRWANLREATRAQNQWNTALDVRNTSGFKGVNWHKQKQRWRAYIFHLGRHISLGYHATPELAHAAYVAKAIELRGDFARAA